MPSSTGHTRTHCPLQRKSKRIPKHKKRARLQHARGLHVVFLKVCYLLSTWTTSTKGLQRCLTSAWVHFTMPIRLQTRRAYSPQRIKGSMEFHMDLPLSNSPGTSPSQYQSIPVPRKFSHQKSWKTILKVQSLITTLNDHS